MAEPIPTCDVPGCVLPAGHEAHDSFHEDADGKCWLPDDEPSDAPRTMLCPPGPALVYVAACDLPEIHIVDDEVWDPARLSARDRAICRALLQHALAKLDGESDG